MAFNVEKDKVSSWLNTVVPLDLSFYIGSVGLAHLGEFLFVARFHTHQLKWGSFLIDQSREYVMAHAFALFEYFLDWLLVYLLAVDVYEYQSFAIIAKSSFFLGVLMISIGHVFRIGAMFTAA